MSITAMMEAHESGKGPPRWPILLVLFILFVVVLFQS